MKEKELPSCAFYKYGQLTGEKYRSYKKMEAGNKFIFSENNNTQHLH